MFVGRVGLRVLAAREHDAGHPLIQQHADVVGLGKPAGRAGAKHGREAALGQFGRGDAVEGGPACVERCPVNIRIKQGLLKSDKMCLSEPKADKETWNQLRSFQTFAGSPAQGKKA